MKPFCRAMKVDLRRSLLSGSFLLTVALLLVMQYLAVFSMLTNASEGAFAWPYYLNFANAINSMPTTVLFIACVCYSWSYCRDRDSGFYDQAVQRVGFRSYCLSRLVSTALSAFLAGILAVSLFALYLMTLAPLGDDPIGYIGQPAYMTLVGEGRVGLFFLLRCVHTGLLCAMASVLGLAVSAFIPNTHVAIFSPYLLFFTVHDLAMLMNTRWFMPNRLLFSQVLRNDVQNFLFASCVMVDITVIGGYVFYRRAERRR
ncbi:MAG: hypothetical protein ACI3V3_07635 [Faecousia sp.]